jgi:hypothetical protein
LKTFDEWFDEKFPEESFGSLKGAFRLGVKNDIARKAYEFAVASSALIADSYLDGTEISNDIRNLK